MSVHKYTAVNPLINPVKSGDIIIAESGERYIVTQGMCGSYALRHAKTDSPFGDVYDGQMAICTYIDRNFCNI